MPSLNETGMGECLRRGNWTRRAPSLNERRKGEYLRRGNWTSRAPSLNESGGVIAVLRRAVNQLTSIRNRE